MGFMKKLFGSHSDRELKNIYPIADKVEAFAEEYREQYYYRGYICISYFFKSN